MALLAILDEGAPPGDEAAEVDTAGIIVDLVRHVRHLDPALPSRSV